MRIAFRKISNERHELIVTRESGGEERVVCETRSFLMHDLLHFAVETAAGTKGGFWGQLARGRTLAAMREEADAEFAKENSELAMIERVVGGLHGLTKGADPEVVLAGLRANEEAMGKLPEWLTRELVKATGDRLRQLTGHWHATPFGESMVLDWP